MPKRSFLIAPDDFGTLAALAELDTLILISCENESIDGSCLNCRTVFAKPVE